MSVIDHDAGIADCDVRAGGGAQSNAAQWTRRVRNDDRVPSGCSERDLIHAGRRAVHREFRVLTGGVFHSSGGADRDEVKFTPVKTAPHTYQFTVNKDTGGGEYGILPPGTGNVTNGGKIYTFAIVE